MGGPNRLRLFTEVLARASDPTHPAHEYIAEHHRLSLAYAAKLLRIRQNNGLAHPDVDPERFGREIVAIWDRVQAQWLVHRDFDLADAVTAAFPAKTSWKPNAPWNNSWRGSEAQHCRP